MKLTGIPVPEGKQYLFIEEAATLLETSVWGIYNRIRREIIPPSCIVQERPGARILLDRERLERLYPKERRGLRAPMGGAR